MLDLLGDLRAQHSKNQLGTSQFVEWSACEAGNGSEMVLSGDVALDRNLASFRPARFFDFSTSGNGRGSSAEADRIGSVMEEESQQWSILPGWMCRWRKRRFASWHETALSFTRRRCRLRRRISRPSLRSFQPADASYSRPAEWLRCSTMVYANSDCRLSASRAGRPIRR